MPLTVRPVRESDLESLAIIEQRSGQSSWTLEKIRQCWLTASYQCWLIEQGTDCMAYGIILIASDESHLMQLVVDRSYQRQQLGERLLRHLLDVAKHAGAQRIFLEVRVDNLAAIGLYEKMGFRVIGTRKNYYNIDGRAIDAFVYQRD